MYQNFKKLNLPIYNNLQEELEKIINWRTYQQICITVPKGHENDTQFGTGSLIYDWDNSYNENGKMIIPERNHHLHESDFTEIATIFKDTIFEEIVVMLRDNKYNLGRVRLMTSKPKTCLSWHTDSSYRLHYPIKTQLGCKMIIENEVADLEENQWWWTNTIKEHTAINSSTDLRMHLVACVL